MVGLHPLALGATVIMSMTACGQAAILGPESLGRGSAMGIVLSVAVPRQALVPGDTARIQTSVRNTNSFPVTLNFAAGCQVLYYVEDAGGQVVAPDGGGWMCAAAVTSLTLGPGAVETRTFEWTMERTIRNGTRAHAEPLPPGRYQVYATLDSEAVRLRTSPVPITLR